MRMYYNKHVPFLLKLVIYITRAENDFDLMCRVSNKAVGKEVICLPKKETFFIQRLKSHKIITRI